VQGNPSQARKGRCQRGRVSELRYRGLDSRRRPVKWKSRPRRPSWCWDGQVQQQARGQRPWGSAPRPRRAPEDRPHPGRRDLLLLPGRLAQISSQRTELARKLVGNSLDDAARLGEIFNARSMRGYLARADHTLLRERVKLWVLNMQTSSNSFDVTSSTSPSTDDEHPTAGRARKRKCLAPPPQVCRIISAKRAPSNMFQNMLLRLQY